MRVDDAMKPKSFVEGNETGDDCPKCGKPLLYVLGFRDEFSHTSGHYTSDVYLIACSDENCDYCEELDEYDSSDDDYERMRDEEVEEIVLNEAEEKRKGEK